MILKAMTRIDDQKEQDKGDDISNLRPITVLSADLRILPKMFVKRLVRLVGGLDGDAESRTIPGMTIPDNLQLLHIS